MGSSFTREEQRFVLAEMIKSSSVDVHVLANFIKTNVIRPDWMRMHMPLGRNMNDCMKIAEHLSIPVHNEGRTPPKLQESALCRQTMPHEQPELHSSRPGAYGIANYSTPAAPSNILPRPLLPSEQTQVHTSSPSSPRPQRRKRGRPSRGEVARRDTLRPLLPQQYVPATSPPTLSYSTPRPILPATAKLRDSQNVSPRASGVLSPPLDEQGQLKRRRRRSDTTPEPFIQIAPKSSSPATRNA